MQNALIKTTPQSLQKLSRALAITEKLLVLDFFEDNFYKKLLDKSNIDLAIEFALNARLELDWYYDPFDLDIIQILKDEDTKKEWKESLTEKILRRIASKDLSFQANFRFEFPKNNFENRSTLYTPFEDYVIRYLLGIIIFEFKDGLLNDKSINYNDDIFSLIKTPENQRPPAKFIQWQEDNFFNGDYRFMAHFDIKSFFASVSHKLLLEIISKKIGLNTNSFFFHLLKSTLLIREVQEDAIIEKNCGLVIQAIDRFFSDIFLESIDNIFNDFDDNILYQRKIDDIFILFNNVSEYPKITSKIENGLKEINLNLNNEKTKIYDKLDIGEDKLLFYFLLDQSAFENFGCLISLGLINNYKNGIGNRSIILKEVKGDETDILCIMQNYIYGENAQDFINIRHNVVALLDSSVTQKLRYGESQFMMQLIFSNISTEMKIKIIKEHFEKFYHMSKMELRLYAEKINPYFQYVILKCILQDLSLNSSGIGNQYSNFNTLEDYERYMSVLREHKLDNQLLQSIVDYSSLKY